jgi:hypothetical protein
MNSAPLHAFSEQLLLTLFPLALQTSSLRKRKLGARFVTLHLQYLGKSIVSAGIGRIEPDCFL